MTDPVDPAGDLSGAELEPVADAAGLAPTPAERIARALGTHAEPGATL